MGAELVPVDAVDDGDGHDTDDDGGDPAGDLCDQGIGAKVLFTGQKEADLGGTSADDLQKARTEQEYEGQQEDSGHQTADHDGPVDLLGGESTGAGVLNAANREASIESPPIQQGMNIRNNYTIKPRICHKKSAYFSGVRSISCICTVLDEDCVQNDYGRLDDS